MWLETNDMASVRANRNVPSLLSGRQPVHSRKYDFPSLLLKDEKPLDHHHLIKKGITEEKIKFPLLSEYYSSARKRTRISKDKPDKKDE